MVHHPDDTGPKRRSGQAGKDAARPARGDKPHAGKGKFEKSTKGGKPGAPAKPTGRGERIAKALARAGVASRRDVEKLISLGKVVLNGRVIDTPATFVHKEDVLVVDGKTVGSAEATRVWRYNKPVGLVTSHRDPEGRPTVFDALPKGLPRVISVGRLDLNSEGLLLLTNDGGLSRGLELPTSGWKRTYRVRAHGRVEQKDLDRLADGIEVDGVRYGSIEAKLDKAKAVEGGSNAWITVTLSEGKNREIRKVFEAIGLRVNRLMRMAYGPFQLGSLGLGEIEEIGPRVIREQLAGLIEPENLPTGDKVLHTPPAPSRRPIPKSGLANPKAKPSQVKANMAIREEAEAEKSARGGPRVFHGDRPAPRFDRGGGSRTGDPKRSYGKPREDGPREDRGDRPYRPREGAADDRPRTFKPRPDGDRPYRPREGGDDRPRPPFKPRGDAPERPRGPRPDRPFNRDGEAPKRPYAPRDGDGEKRAYKPRDGDGPKGAYKPRDNAGPGEKRPYKPREESADGGKPSFRPREGARPDDNRPFKPRDGEAPKRPYAGKPGGGAGGKPGGFKRGPASRGPGSSGPPRGGKPSGPRGPRKP